MDEREARDLISLSTKLAVQARDVKAHWRLSYEAADCCSLQEFWGIQENRRNRRKPIVAASIGPYGAFLADGSEFTGAYATSISKEQLKDFHRPRIQVGIPKFCCLELNLTPLKYRLC